MAQNRKPTRLTIDLNTVVANAANSIRGARSEYEAKQELEFQKAIADGMSYEDQIKFRQKQVQELKESPFYSVGQEASLETSVTQTKKLARFKKFRMSYDNTLAELTEGVRNNEEQLNYLRDQLSAETDPQLREEINTRISETRKSLETDKRTLITNRSLLAEKDGTRAELEKAISTIVSAKYEASVKGDDAEVTLRDGQLLALKGQLETVKVVDAVNSWRVTSTSRGTTPEEKLSFMNSMAQTTTAGIPVTIDGKRYNNGQEFWLEKRTNFLSGQDETFGNFFSELSDSVDNRIKKDALVSGTPTAATLDFVNATLNSAIRQPGLEAFVDRIEALRADKLAPSVAAYAGKIADIASNNLDHVGGAREIENIGKRYGVDVTSYLVNLAARAANDLTMAMNSGSVTREDALRMAPQVDPALPKIDPEKQKNGEPRKSPFGINIEPTPTAKSVFPETEQPQERPGPMVVEPNQPNNPPLTGANPPTLVTIKRKNAITGADETNQVYESDVEHWKTQGWNV